MRADSTGKALRGHTRASLHLQTGKLRPTHRATEKGLAQGRGAGVIFLETSPRQEFISWFLVPHTADCRVSQTVGAQQTSAAQL